MAKAVQNDSHKTLHNKKALVEAMEKSLGVVTTACRIVGISRWTYYDYYKNDVEFKKQIDDIQNIAIDYAESKLHEAIKDGNVTSIIFYLKTKGKDRGYIERVENVYSSADKNNFPEWLEDESES